NHTKPLNKTTQPTTTPNSHKTATFFCDFFRFFQIRPIKIDTFIVSDSEYFITNHNVIRDTSPDSACGLESGGGAFRIYGDFI
ncbi:MAG: hypothetical protein IK060_05700, partial [Methanomicrobium sp.]|nr:hypothetical protein [Methanomicrobium sp.]